MTETIGARKAALYLADDTDGDLRLHTVLNAGPLPKSLEAVPDDFLGRQKATESRRVKRSLATAERRQLLAAGLILAVASVHPGTPDRRLARRSRADGRALRRRICDLLTTLGEQAASATATVQLSERLAQSRAFEGFNRLSSFIIHDLKNSVSALSMLTQNARQALRRARLPGATR